RAGGRLRIHARPMDLPASSQRSAATFGQELRELARLAAPIAFVQFGMTSLGFVDVAFLGHYQATALPAMALGNTLTWNVLVCCLGVLIAIDPVLSQAVGARDHAAIGRTLVRGGMLAVLLTLPAVALLLPAPLWLELLGQKPELIPGAGAYARL